MTPTETPGNGATAASPDESDTSAGAWAPFRIATLLQIDNASAS